MTDHMIELDKRVRRILKEAPDECYCSKDEIEFYAELQNIYEYLTKLKH